MGVVVKTTTLSARIVVHLRLRSYCWIVVDRFATESVLSLPTHRTSSAGADVRCFFC